MSAQEAKHPLPLAADRPHPRCYYGDIARFTAVVSAVALEGARGAQQTKTGKLLEIGGRRLEGKGRCQSMAVGKVCGVSAVAESEEGVVGEEQRAAAAVLSALGEGAHLWLERKMEVRVRAKGTAT